MAQTVEVDIIDNYPDWMSKAYDLLRTSACATFPSPEATTPALAAT